MSRIYDDSCIHIPHNAWGYDSFYLDGEEYYKIPNHPYYYINMDGDILSVRRPHNPIFLKPWENQYGHKSVKLDGVKLLVHRIMADTFLDNSDNYPVVRHLDDDPRNNNILNLEWGTYKDNYADCVRNGHEFRRSVYCFEKDVIYRTGAAAAKDLGVSRSAITLCCEGKIGNVNGFHLCYEDEIEERRNDPDWFRERNNFKPIIAYKDNGEELYFDSRKAAAEYLGIPDCGISSVVRGHLKHTHGWRFREG